MENIEPVEAAITGFFTVECRDKDGKLKWVEKIKNGVTAEGVTRMLNTMFGSGTYPKITAWYLGLIDNSPTPTLASGDMHSSHASWTENVAYSQSTRPQWTPADLNPAAPTNPNTSANGSVVTFTINGTATIYGVFLANINTKSSTASGVLYSTAAFGTPQSVVNTDSLTITYQATLTGS